MTGRWVLTIMTDKQGNFFKEKARWVLRGARTNRRNINRQSLLLSTRPGFRISCQMAASKRCYIFHIDLETAFLQAQSYGVNRDVVSQLPPEAGHPPHIAARLKKPAYGMNDAPRRWWNILDKQLCSCGIVPTRADRCCMCCTQPKRVSKIGTERVIHRDMIHMPSHLNRVRDHREMLHLRECWILLKEAQLQANPWQES